MAAIAPLRALRYDLARTGGLAPVVAPPYDVIDAEQRAALVARSPHNVVEIDLPQAPDGGDPYLHAAETLSAWIADGVVVRDEEPALWALEQDYTGPDGRRRTRHGAPRPRAGGGLRRRAHPAARAHAPGAEGGPAAAHAGHAGEPLADLLPLRRRRVAGARAAPRRAAVRRGDRRRRHGAPPVADRRPRGHRGRHRGARAGRAPDRRRPPPLRDRARARRGDGRGGSRTC